MDDFDYYFEMAENTFAVNFEKLEIDFSAICGIGGAAVVANLKNGNVAKIEKMDINDKLISEKIVKDWEGDDIYEGEKQLGEFARKTEFLTVEQIKEEMKNKNLDFGFILMELFRF